MVVTAQDLLKRIEEKERSLLKTLEQEIDNELSKKFKGQSKLDVNLNNKSWEELTDSAQVKLINKYRNAGWDVKHCDESEQGVKVHYLTFNYKAK